jgi:hypothetical protein
MNILHKHGVKVKETPTIIQRRALHEHLTINQYTDTLCCRAATTTVLIMGCRAAGPFCSWLRVLSCLIITK